MCVVFVVDKDRPSEQMVEQAFRANPSGAGIAWRTEHEGEKGVKEVLVSWSKGLNLDSIQTLCKNAPLPYICHFRIPTVGGDNPKLCHPFPIDKAVPLFLQGTTGGSVLFHNGHWSSWKDLCVRASVSGNGPIPEGEWSDTRAMAWMASICGLRVLEFIDEKAAILDPYNEIEIFGSGWSRLNGVLVSNTHFHRPYSYNDSRSARTMCAERACSSTDIDSTGFCPKHRVTKPVQDTGSSVPAKSAKESAKVLLPGADSDEPAYSEVAESATDTEGSGGNPTPDPFRQPVQTPLKLALNTYEEACKQYQEGRLSNNKMKKARRAWELAQERYKLASASSVEAVQTLH